MPCSLGWGWAGTGNSRGWSSAQKLLQVTWQMPPAVVEVGLLCSGVSETPSPLPSATSSSVQGACLPGGAVPHRCSGLEPEPHPKPTPTSPPAIFPAHLGQRGPAGGSTLPSLLLHRLSFSLEHISPYALPNKLPGLPAATLGIISHSCSSVSCTHVQSFQPCPGLKTPPCGRLYFQPLSCFVPLACRSPWQLSPTLPASGHFHRAPLSLEHPWW